MSAKSDDFIDFEDFTYTLDLPNFIIKKRYPNYDKNEYPKLYKIQNLTELNALKITDTTGAVTINSTGGGGGGTDLGLVQAMTQGLQNIF